MAHELTTVAKWAVNTAQMSEMSKQTVIHQKINSPKTGDRKDFPLFQKRTKMVRQRCEFQRSLFFKQRSLKCGDGLVSVISH